MTLEDGFGEWQAGSTSGVPGKCGAISSEGTHITATIMFAWHSCPVTGHLLSSVPPSPKKEKKDTLWERSKIKMPRIKNANSSKMFSAQDSIGHMAR